MKTCICPVIAASVSVDSYGFFSVDLEGLVLLVSPILSGSMLFLPPFPRVSWAVRAWIWWRHPRVKSAKEKTLCPWLDMRPRTMKNTLTLIWLQNQCLNLPIPEFVPKVACRIPPIHEVSELKVPRIPEQEIPIHEVVWESDYKIQPIPSKPPWKAPFPTSPHQEILYKLCNLFNLLLFLTQGSYPPEFFLPLSVVCCVVWHFHWSEPNYIRTFTGTPGSVEQTESNTSFREAFPEQSRVVKLLRIRALRTLLGKSYPAGAELLNLPRVNLPRSRVVSYYAHGDFVVFLAPNCQDTFPSKVQCLFAYWHPI